MTTLQELRDQRSAAWAQAQEYNTRSNDPAKPLSAEEEASWQRAMDDIDRLAGMIATRERTEKFELPAIAEKRDGIEELDDHPLARAAYGKAWEAWARGGMGNLEVDQRTELRAGVMDVRETRAAGVGTNSAGGYFVPAGFRNDLIVQMKFFSAMRDVSTVISTDTGASLAWPTVDDTGNVGAILAENTQISEQDVTIGTASLGAYKYTSKLVRVSYELLQDSYFDFAAFLTARLAERIARIQNTHFTTGTGSSQPLGVQTNATVGKTGTTGQTLTVIYDDLIDLIHSIDPAYRNGGRQRFMMNDASLAIARKLKDSQGRPLWEPSLQVGAPDSLLGYPITINNDMPVMAANAKSILFGDFQAAYVIRDVLGVQMVRLEERYADYLQVGFFGFARSDATLQNASAVKAYKNSAT